MITAQRTEIASERNAIDINRRRINASVLLNENTGRPESSVFNLATFTAKFTDY